MIGPFDVNYWDYKDTDVYMKGALTLHTLRNIINNDSVFFDIIKTFYSRYKYSIVTSRDFISLVNKKTNDDLNWFFDQYLYSRICPQMEWNYVYDKLHDCYEFSYRWNNTSSDLNIPVSIRSGGIEYTLYPTLKTQTLKISTGNDIAMNIENSYISLKKNKKL
ncbi:MAG: hypothetical protein JXK95_11410 [Bacteroidales bacterium]|nr:hypothetical protein [Bacteroidales bacterium]